MPRSPSPTLSDYPWEATRAEAKRTQELVAPAMSGSPFPSSSPAMAYRSPSYNAVTTFNYSTVDPRLLDISSAAVPRATLSSAFQGLSTSAQAGDIIPLPIVTAWRAVGSAVWQNMTFM